ncbi:F0F1 ATP synthase subunit B' [Afipia sp. P52-10]|jgi:F-type H+-transporting ATPase subunit b|uniref:F0F1 ATP synthase subunit B family protein n=1 Tax=Afipia sp. P52-10 TaxID=1429916 RepID=UPI0003DF1CC2|nr:ATP synthase subunit B [Afipia sp. P52-10]ETR77191.1 F0F1 ATP synthase subunit B' [Afipia sp. P52-10]
MALISPANAATTPSSGTSHGTEDAHGKGGFPPFQSETFASQLVSFAIAFILLYVIVSKFALPRVGGIIANRQGTIDGDLAEAQRLKSESDAALKAYETELATARANAQAIGSDIRDKLSKQADEERKQLEDRLAGKLADAEKAIAATRATAMGNVRSIASDAAAAIVQRLAGTAPDPKAVDAAVDASLKG